MIDFIKIHYRDKSDFESFVLMEGNFENVYGQVDAHTGEIGYPYKTKFETMDYVVSQKTGYIKNSLHKFYNNAVYGQDQNHNDFTYSNLKHSINHLRRKMVDLDCPKYKQISSRVNISFLKMFCSSMNFLICSNSFWTNSIIFKDYGCAHPC